MNVLYDYQAFLMQRFGGVSKYFTEIIRNLILKSYASPIISDYWSNNVYDGEIYQLINKKSLFHNAVDNYYKRGAYKAYPIVKSLNKRLSANFIKQGKFDLFHPTYYDPYFVKHIKNKPYVLTVHDMIHEKFSSNFNTNNRVAADKKALINGASKIIAISENTKTDIVNILNIDPGKINVVYHGINFNHITASTYNLPTPDNYVLYVGERHGYKNFSRFVKSYSEVYKIYPELKLVCTGKAFSDDELILFKTLNIDKSIIHCFVADDSQLSKLYSDAQLFAYPSLYEGFGMPLLEAFACGCPVISSNSSCFPEIAGEASEYFDPLSEQSMKLSMLKVLNDRVYRANLIENGKVRVKKFSWDKSAFETAEVYKSVLNT